MSEEIIEKPKFKKITIDIVGRVVLYDHEHEGHITVYIKKFETFYGGMYAELVDEEGKSLTVNFNEDRCSYIYPEKDESNHKYED